MLQANGKIQRVQSLMMDARIRGLDQPATTPLRIDNQTDQPDTIRAIVLLVDFSDNQADTINYPQSHFDELLFSVGTFPTGSYTDYYLEVSYDAVIFVGEIAGYYRMPQTYEYYTDSSYGIGDYPRNAQRMTEDAVWAADPDVDFSIYDNDNNGYVDAIFIVHAGRGAEQTGDVNDIWSHKWAVPNPPLVDGVYVFEYCTEPEDGHIGVFCHEAGHLIFGLPDLYDYDYDSRGVGYWTLMASGSWLNGGRNPAHLDAYCKIEAGFVNPVTLNTNNWAQSIPLVETNPIIYKLWTDGILSSQYFLVENRQHVGYDYYLPGDGLLIYHVDETRWNNNNQWYPGYTAYGHYLVAVEQADGNWDLEQYVNGGDTGDPWPGST
ncbi:hypothetical protein AMJ86_01815, partial [bacterium SM23_57]